LLAHIETPAISISDLMIEVRKQVLRATNDQQEPWDQSSLRERFCFKPLAVIPAPKLAFEADPPPQSGGALTPKALPPVKKDSLPHVTNDESRSTEIGMAEPTRVFLTLVALVFGVGLTAIPLIFLAKLFK
jgi:hypothetical protein